MAQHDEFLDLERQAQDLVDTLTALKQRMEKYDITEKDLRALSVELKRLIAEHIEITNQLSSISKGVSNLDNVKFGKRIEKLEAQVETTLEYLKDLKGSLAALSTRLEKISKKQDDVKTEKIEEAVERLAMRLDDIEGLIKKSFDHPKSDKIDVTINRLADRLDGIEKLIHERTSVSGFLKRITK